MALPLFDDDTAAQILRQVEFYFSDSNIPYDKFLLRCVKESDDGLVGLPLICSFSRMRNLLGLKESGPDKVPTSTVTAVAEILRKSSTLRISDDSQRIGRLHPLVNPEEMQEIVNSRTVAVSPLPWRITMAEIESFFSQYAKVKSVRLPRHAKARAFSGSALVEFAMEEDARKVLEIPISYQGADLELRPKKVFDEEMEKTNFSVDRQGQSWRTTGRDNTQHNGSFPKGLIVSFSLRKMKEDGNIHSGKHDVSDSSVIKDEAGGDENTTMCVNLADGNNIETLNDKGAALDDNKVKDTDEEKHEILSNDGSTEADKEKEVNTSGEMERKSDNEENLLNREDIRELLQRFGTVKYVDYGRGATSGYVRFEHPEGAQKVRTAAVLSEEDGLAVKGYIATFEAVEGDAETEYWVKLRSGQDRKREMVGDKFSRKRGRNFRGKEGKKEAGVGTESGKDAPGVALQAQSKHLHFDDDDDAEGEPVSKRQETEVVH